MIMQVVYLNKDGLSLIKIVEDIKTKYDIQTNTREIEQIIRKNRKLFVEVNGKFKSPFSF